MMTADKERIQYLEDQIEQLQREKRTMLEAIEIAANLSNFRVSLNRLEDPLPIIRETADRLRNILEFKAVSFYLVDEKDSNFYQVYTDPVEFSERIDDEVDALIEDKTFSWALSRNKPVMVSSIDKMHRVVLHSMSTSSRVRGILVGILAYTQREISDFSLFLFSITMVACSNALESFELYRQIRERNVQLKKNLLEMEEKEEKYRALFEQAANAIILYDPVSRKTVEFNDTAHQSLGYTREEFKKLKLGDFDVDDTVIQDLDKHLRHVYEDGQLAFETRQKRKDGKIKDVIVSYRPVRIQGKTYLLSLVTDITAQKENELQRLNLEKQLRQAQKMESIGTLAGGIAHDFNNILAIILGYAELSMLDIPTNLKNPRSNISQLITAVERAKKLVMQILTFSRQGEEEHIRIEINSIINESLALLRSTLPTTVNIIKEIQKEPLYVEGDPTQIHQVLMNLCTNAVHAMTGKNGELRIKLERMSIKKEEATDQCHYCCKDIRPGSYVQITVADNGNGMTPEIIERVFDPYFTTKKPGEGTGLGLAVVHGIVERYNGHIAICSKPGQGTIFNIRIPEVEPPIIMDEEEELLIFS